MSEAKYNHLNSWKIKELHEKQLALNTREYQSAGWPQHWNFLLEVGKKNFNKETKVLDIGCGCGFLNLLLKNETEIEGSNYTGVDYSENAIKIAKENFPGNFYAKSYNELTKDFTNNFDYGIISALTNVLPNGDEALEYLLSLDIPNLLLLKILKTQDPYHRSTYLAYDTATTYRYEHNEDKFHKTILDYGYNVVYNIGNEYFIKK